MTYGGVINKSMNSGVKWSSQHSYTIYSLKYWTWQLDLALGIATIPTSQTSYED